MFFVSDSLIRVKIFRKFAGITILCSPGKFEARFFRLSKFLQTRLLQSPFVMFSIQPSSLISGKRDALTVANSRSPEGFIKHAGILAYAIISLIR